MQVEHQVGLCLCHMDLCTCKRRRYVQVAAEQEYSQRLVFLNSVPLLKSLSRDEKAQIANALVEEVHEGQC